MGEEIHVGRVIERRVGPYASFYLNIPKPIALKLKVRKGDVFKIEIIDEKTIKATKLT